MLFDTDTPHRTVISGSSGSGKTTLLVELLQRFCHGEVHFFFKHWQPLYHNIKNASFYRYYVDKSAACAKTPPPGVAMRSQLENLVSRVEPGATFVFDDALEAIKSPIVEEFFTRISHHRVYDNSATAKSATDNSTTTTRLVQSRLLSNSAMLISATLQFD